MKKYSSFLILHSSFLLLLLLVASCKGGTTTQTTTEEPLVYEQLSPAFCADSAYAYIEKQCSYGPRTMNSAAHEQCGNWIADKFRSFGAVITDQYADSKLYDGTSIRLRNIIASVNPEAPVRVIVSGHWDSRPWADHDSDDSQHHTAILGANDGGSSIGMMLEIARQLSLLADTCQLAVGIDFICWDAEDCGTPSFAEKQEGSENTWCLGSQYWAEHPHAEGYRARWGINLDMVGGNNSIFRKEGYSMHFAPSYVDRIWSTAKKLGYENFFPGDDSDGAVTDDHVQVNKAGIPCVDIIGNDVNGSSFPTTWHTINDTPQNINIHTLQAVGQTVMEVLWNEK